MCDRGRERGRERGGGEERESMKNGKRKICAL